MSNHYHLALRTGPVSLSRSIGFVQFRYGQDYNQRHRSTGPRWQSRFKAKLVEDERYLLQLIAYIYLNPVAAGVVPDPAEYRYSGHRELIGATTAPLVDATRTLALYGDTVRKARRAYVGALEGAQEQGWRTSLPGSLPWWGRETDRPLEPPPPAAWVDQLGLSTRRDRPPLEAGEFLTRCCGLLAAELGRLVSPVRDAETCRLRFLVAGVGIERWRQRPGELARCLGRWPEAVGRWAKRAGELRLADAEFRAASESLDERLSREVGDHPTL